MEELAGLEENDMYYWGQGFLLGLAYVAPIGMQNLFVLNNALLYQRRQALFSACVVIFFDVTLSLACFFGIGALMERYVWLQTGTLLIGGILVLTIGVGLLRKKTQMMPTESGKALSVGALLKEACIVTWCNPQAILDGTMMLGAFRAVLPATQSIVFLFGVVSASCAWFLGFTLLVSLLGQRFSSAVLRAINVLCGAVLVFYGANLLLQFIKLILGGT